MAKPNSLLTKIRTKLVDVINPVPDPGEGWCMDCKLVNGETVIISADGLNEHIALHTAVDGTHHVQIKTHHPA